MLGTFPQRTTGPGYKRNCRNSVAFHLCHSNSERRTKLAARTTEGQGRKTIQTCKQEQ